MLRFRAKTDGSFDFIIASKEGQRSTRKSSWSRLVSTQSQLCRSFQAWRDLASHCFIQRSGPLVRKKSKAQPRSPFWEVPKLPWTSPTSMQLVELPFIGLYGNQGLVRVGLRRHGLRHLRFDWISSSLYGFCLVLARVFGLSMGIRAFENFSMAVGWGER